MGSTSSEPSTLPLPSENFFDKKVRRSTTRQKEKIEKRGQLQAVPRSKARQKVVIQCFYYSMCWTYVAQGMYNKLSHPRSLQVQG
eukprot:3347045-Rhodomonas_salina.1